MELLDFDDVSSLFLEFVVSEDKLGETINVDLSNTYFSHTFYNNALKYTNLPIYLLFP